MLDNPKHEKFAQVYAETFDASEAYRAAGYKAKNGDAVAACASRLLATAKVRARVEELLERAAARAELSLDDVLEEIRLIAFARLGNAVDWGPDGIVLRPSTELADAESAAIASVSEVEIEMGKMVKRTLSIKLHDKLAALEKLMRRLGAYPPQQIDHTSKGDKIPLAVFHAAMRDGGTDGEG